MARTAAAKKSEVPAGARIEYVRIDEVARWPRNAKKHDKPGIRASLKRFGWIDPVIEDARSSRLVAGHGRLEVALEMHAEGAEVPRGVQVDPKSGMWLIPVLRGIAFENDHEAEAYLVANNRLVENGGYDESVLREILADHQTDLAGTGFSAEEVSTMLAELAGGDAGGRDIVAPEDFKEVTIDVKTDYCCPKCGYEWSGKQS